jgi:hypothetical protein
MNVFMALASEAEFLDVNGTTVLRVFILSFHSHLFKQILLLPPGAKLG